MKKIKKQIFMKIVIAAAGLVLVYILGRWLSAVLYSAPKDQGVSASTGTSMTAPKPALTEAQIEELFRSMREEPGTNGDVENGTAALKEADGAEASQAPDGAGLSTGGGNDGSISGAAGPDGEGSEGAGLSRKNGELDFSALWEINKDIYAWITIPGTNIDYPILQHPTDDSYYLNYNIDGSYGHPGCIYTESLNAKEFTDPNTVIYGHNLKEKTMFTELHKFESRDFFEEHKEIIIYLPDKTLHYTVFAAHVYDDRHLLYSFDFADKDIFANYLQSIYDIRDMNANIDRDFTVTAEDKMITLVTCMPKKADADKRLLVQAVLTGED